jgi:outer membrane protein TolC
MLERRPDIQSAWFALQSQEWAVVEAKADRLPALSLTGSASLTSPRFETLFSNWAMNLASGLTAPLMDGGRRRAVVLREQALADERFLAYRDAVLAALHEVADALSSEHWQREYTARLQIEADLAARTLAETQRRYRSGLSDYLPVLTALSSQQRTELGVISAQTELLSDRIKLYQAVGGQVLPATSGADGEKTLPVGGGE